MQKGARKGFSSGNAPVDRAPRVPLRVWRGLSRGAVLAFSLWLTGAAATAAQEIVAARYEAPTDRYPHGVLGDDIEYAGLAVTLSDGQVLRMRWDSELVFEDIAPRLADLDGDGAPEVITVESHQANGARLSVWGLVDGALTPIAAVPFIGTRFRWLAPAGAADLDGDGVMELAYVDRPHLAKTLRIWRYEASGRTVRLREVATQPGLTNHRIGEAFITGGVRDCGAGPEIITANANWTRIMASRLIGNRIETRDIGAFSGAASVDAAMACQN